MWDTIIAPWLLANCLVALFILGVWFPTVIYREIEKAEKKVATEREWEEIRLEGKK